ncbi:MAG: GAF domain-containing sensor histidine kinase, partial [Candidatus Margulisiibacteriota bacterium]
LLDIEIVIKKTAVYSILTALLTGFFVSLILISNQLFSRYTGYSSIWASILGAFVVAFLFQPLRDKIQVIVDHIFFRARYDYQRILRKYSYALSQPMLDLDRFCYLAPYLLTKSMKLSGASVMVLDRAERCYKVRAGVGNAQNIEGIVIPESSSLIKKIITTKKELSRDEEKDQEIVKIMDELKCTLIIPSISWSEYFKKPTLLCTTNLGEKLSGESFSREDIEFLKTLANQAAISIEYAFILEELRKHQEQVIKSEKMATLGVATAGIAHELKNPLTYIMTVAQALPQSWDNPKFRETVISMLPSEVERMKLIIEGVLNFSRTRELSLQPLEISEVIKKTLALLAYEIKKGKVYLKEEYHHQAKILGDQNRLTQVFVNIINNAIQAMEEKGGELTILTQDLEKSVKINIIDTGPGMSKEILQKIFDPFFTTKESGSGLGLAITKKIIDEHQGTISVTSILGKGTNFAICLPQA